MKLVLSFVFLTLVPLLAYTNVERAKSSPFNLKAVPSSFQEGLRMRLMSIQNQQTLASPDLTQIYSFFQQNSIENIITKLQQPADISANCSKQWSVFTSALSNGTLWALTAVDSYGKPPAGALFSVPFIRWVGDYKECISIEAVDWKSKYCSLSLSDLGTPLPIVTALCVPDECSERDIAHMLNSAFRVLIAFGALKPRNETEISCISNQPLPFDTGAIVALVILSIIVVVVIVSTLIDIAIVYKSELKEFAKWTTGQSKKKYVVNEAETPQQEDKTPAKQSAFLSLILSFSLYTNTAKLFRITKNPDQLGCLNGIRYLSIGWVVLGHVYYIASFGAIDNIVVTKEWGMRVSFQVVANAFFAVDSFFLLSGILISYGFQKEVRKRGLSFGLMIKYYVHRLWRITPPYMLVIMLLTCLSKYFGKGPYFPVGGLEPYCADRWYTNLLYVNNL